MPWQPSRSPTWPILGALLILVPLWRIADLRAAAAAPLFWALLAVLGLWIMRQDRWAGIFALYVIGRALLSKNLLAFETTWGVVGGLIFLVVAQQASATGRRWLEGILVAAGLVQVAFVTVQWWRLPAEELTAGSIGNASYLGVFLAIVGAGAPVWLLPVFGWGILLTRARIGALGFLVALCVRYPKARLAVLCGGLTVLAVTFMRHGWNMDSVAHRMWVTGIALKDLAAVWWAPLVGYGPAAWLNRVLFLQRDSSAMFSEIFGQAHNEYLQLAYEGGLVALALVGMWAWAHRAAFRAHPGVAAIAITALGMFTFQVAATAVAAMTVFGLASAERGGQEHETGAGGSLVAPDLAGGRRSRARGCLDDSRTAVRP
jgi:hypothetical protein